ncbi:MAG TPA: hypothetical protein VJQ57_02715 [Acidimicrobiia bacterium]|nr:hypothetical protein [Acidimicrobiia bacterium]
MLLFMGGLAAAGAGELPFQLDLIDQDGNISEFEAVGFAVAAGVIFVSFLFGGWVAGRMARYDGALNGVAVALWMLVLVVLFTALGVYFGDQYNALNYLELPNWLTQIDMDERTTTGIIAAIAGVVLVFLAAAIGGKLGEKYHARVDADLVRDERVTVVS